MKKFIAEKKAIVENKSIEEEVAETESTETNGFELVKRNKRKERSPLERTKANERQGEAYENIVKRLNFKPVESDSEHEYE